MQIDERWLSFLVGSESRQQKTEMSPAVSPLHSSPLWFHSSQTAALIHRIMPVQFNREAPRYACLGSKAGNPLH
ncbi:hypothetical protein [Bradyrhizobium sp. LMTR 3]|uniref:hypothetical protein n=1 Tax=Bradyrhizobium sp. LMTR 3 TaxID=189873 RepID=UPI001147A758|nr:hypothetical protein [Bradyrhizobium sp. LMTR 3]